MQICVDAAFMQPPTDFLAARASVAKLRSQGDRTRYLGFDPECEMLIRASVGVD